MRIILIGVAAFAVLVGSCAETFLFTKQHVYKNDYHIGYLAGIKSQEAKDKSKISSLQNDSDNWFNKYVQESTDYNQAESKLQQTPTVVRAPSVNCTSNTLLTTTFTNCY